MTRLLFEQGPLVNGQVSVGRGGRLIAIDTETDQAVELSGCVTAFRFESVAGELDSVQLTVRGIELVSVGTLARLMEAVREPFVREPVERVIQV